MLGQSNYPGAFALLNTLAQATADPLQQACILSLVADGQFRQGQTDEALQTYQQAAELSVGDARQWLRPVVGQIVVLLAEVQISAAQTAASAAIQKSMDFWTAYQGQLTQAAQQTAAGGAAIIPVEPTAPHEVMVRMGNLFLNDGELDFAQDCFQQAIDFWSGSSNALLGLASVSLRKGSYATAITQATQALTAGGYRAGTLKAWPILFAANLRSGTSMDAGVIAGIQNVATGVNAKATLLITQGLRNQRDARWKTVATNWLASSGTSNPIIAAELRKILLADARLSGDSNGIATQTAALLSVDELAPAEFLNAARQKILNALKQGQTADTASLLTKAVNRYGSTGKARILHGLGLAVASGGHASVAISLLTQAQSLSQSGSQQWCRTTWALAKIEKQQGDFSKAADCYASFLSVTTAQGKPRLYLFAQIEWARCVFQSGQPDLISSAQSQISNIVGQINDFEVALDVARQLIRAPLALKPLCTAFRQRGERLAQQAFANAADAYGANVVLFKVARRKLDFGDFDGVLADWNGLSSSTRKWLWGTNSTFWNYLGMVFDAMRTQGDSAGLQTLVSNYLDDAATPAIGVAILGVRYGLFQVSQGQFTDALALFSKVVKASPGTMDCAYAYYWLALSQWQQGNYTQAQIQATSILRVLGTRPGMAWQKALATSAQLFLNNLVVVDPNDTEAQARLDAITADLLKLS
ncbi:MAG: tetratricopeptide repeat protein [Chthoniobacteraceae bacterium]